MNKRPHYNWPMSPEIERRLGSSYGAQRAIAADGQVLLILHAPPRPGQPRDHEVFLRLPAEGNAARWMYEGQDGGQRELMRLLDDYVKILEQLEARHERAQTASELFTIIGPCIPLARAASNMQAALQAARDAAPDDQGLIDQRDRAVEISRGFELLLADTRMELDYRLALAAEEQTRATQEVTLAQRKLNVIAALTFPLMAIGAALGMNLHSGIEDVQGWVFWAVIAAGGMLGLMIKRWVGGPSVREALISPPVAASKGISGKPRR
ncbi:hypothetical protein [Comamonas serinivorans]|nr:hypothetical protein [Comamonas serinivorans]